MHRRLGFAGSLQVVAAIVGAWCAEASAATSPSPLVFEDVTATSGITYTGPSWSIAWGDANNDGLPDLFLGNHGGPHNLFLNRGAGRFAEIESSRLERRRSDAHGVAWADFDNDGDQDLIELVGARRGTAAKANHLFVNENGIFRDRAIERGVDDQYGRGRRPMWFDWDGDGRLDLLILNELLAQGPSALYRNRGGYFDRTNAIGSLGHTRFPLLGSFAANRTHLLISGGWFFPDRILDAYQLSPLPLPDRRAALGVPRTTSITDTALIDVNGDGLDDLLEVAGDLPSDAAIANGRVLSHLKVADLGGSQEIAFKATGTVEFMIAPRAGIWWSPKVVYIGSGGLHPAGIPFTLSTSDPSVYGLSAPRGDRGIYVGYDRAADKWRLRMVATNFQEANLVITAASLSQLETVGFTPFVPWRKPNLFVSTGTGYSDASAAAGLGDAAMASNCFSLAAADFDNDTDVDAVATCSGPLGLANISNQFLRNDGDGHFTLLAQSAGVRRPPSGVADGISTADFDLDGFPDLAVTNGQGIPPFNVGRTQIFRNTSAQAGNGNHWLEVDLRGVTSNRDGVGARLVLVAGGKTQRRLQQNGVHSGGQDFQRIHFGLGAATSVQSLEVTWPNGTRQVEYGLPVDQVVRIVEGSGWSTPFALTPSTQVFGDVPLSTSVTQSFTLTNPGAAAMPILGIRSVGVHAADFIITHRCGSSLAAGSSCQVNVTFKPTGEGSRTGRLMVVAADQVSRLASLAGRGT